MNCSQGILPSVSLSTIGLDSLVAIQLQNDIEKMFGTRPGLVNIGEITKFSDLCDMVFATKLAGPSVSKSSPVMDVKDLPFAGNGDSQTLPSCQPRCRGLAPVRRAFITQAIQEFRRVERNVGSFARRTGFTGFYSGVHKKQMTLVLAYFLEAFRSLGCDLETLGPGNALPQLSYAPKHRKLV